MMFSVMNEDKKRILKNSHTCTHIKNLKQSHPNIFSDELM